MLKSFRDDYEEEKRILAKKHGNILKIQDMLLDKEQQVLTRDSCLAQNN